MAGVLAFVDRHLRPLDAADPLVERESRVRAAVLGACEALAGAHERFDPGATLDVAGAAATIRRWLGAQTFAPRTGDGGVQIVDAATAPYGEFDEVQIVGLIDADWPERERRSIFYPAFLLQSLGWPEERKRLDGARAAFVDLLGLAARRFALSTFTLEDDAIVEPSAFVHEVRALAPPRQVVDEAVPARVFPWEALVLDPLAVDALAEPARTWAALRGRAHARRRCRVPRRGRAVDAAADLGQPPRALSRLPVQVLRLGSAAARRGARRRRQPHAARARAVPARAVRAASSPPGRRPGAARSPPTPSTTRTGCSPATAEPALAGAVAGRSGDRAAAAVRHRRRAGHRPPRARHGGGARRRRRRAAARVSARRRLQLPRPPTAGPAT